MPVYAHGHINRFRSVLVAHKNAVLSRIFHVDLVDGDGAALGLLGDGKLGLVQDFAIIPEPEDLWSRFSIDEAREAERLRKTEDDQPYRWSIMKF